MSIFKLSLKYIMLNKNELKRNIICLSQKRSFLLQIKKKKTI